MRWPCHWRVQSHQNASGKVKEMEEPAAISWLTARSLTFYFQMLYWRPNTGGKKVIGPGL
jgi:hypothetical protein